MKFKASSPPKNKIKNSCYLLLYCILTFSLVDKHNEAVEVPLHSIYAAQKITHPLFCSAAF